MIGAGNARQTAIPNSTNRIIMTAAVNLGPLPPALLPSSMLLITYSFESQRTARFDVPKHNAEVSSRIVRLDERGR